MELSFVDARGKRGRVADNGSVEYNGLWEEEIEQLVDEVTDVPEFGEGKMAEELIIRIPQQTPVKAVERD